MNFNLTPILLTMKYHPKYLCVAKIANVVLFAETGHNLVGKDLSIRKTPYDVFQW